MLVFDQLRCKDPALRGLAILILICMLLLAGLLWRLQVAEAGLFKARQAKQSTRAVRLPGARGKILDRNRHPLALNRPRFNVRMYLKELRPMFRERYDQIKGKRQLTRDEERQLEKEARYQVANELTGEVGTMLGRELVLDPDRFHDHYHRLRYTPVLVLRGLNREEVALFVERANRKPALQLELEPVRAYPNGPLAAHLLGHLRRKDTFDDEESFRFVHRLKDYIGVMGVEGDYDSLLRGSGGAKSFQVNNIGYREKEEVWLWPQAGHDITLALDRDIQRASEEALTSHGPQTRGAVVVMDPRNGDILAMVSRPAFGPEQFVTGLSKDQWNKMNDPQLNAMFNRAVGGAYPPGSIFKIITSLAFLDAGLIDPETEVYNPGWFQDRDLYGPFTMNDTAPPGRYNFRRAFKKSSNTYFIHYALKPDGKNRAWREGLRLLLEWGNRFRLGQKTANASAVTGLPGMMENPPFRSETRGAFPSVDARDRGWFPGDAANLCIGQGAISVTPLQMAVMTAAVANGGHIFQPRLVLRVAPGDPFSEEGEYIVPLRELVDMELDPRHLKTLHDAMLADVEDSDGSGRASRVVGLKIGGKTGTAQKTVQTAKGLRRDLITWFVSFAPVEDPRYAVVVMVESGESGATTCAPIAQKIYRAIQKLRPIDVRQSTPLAMISSGGGMR